MCRRRGRKGGPIVLLWLSGLVPPLARRYVVYGGL